MWSQAAACQTPVTRTRVLPTATAVMTGTAIPAAVIQVCQGPGEMSRWARPGVSLQLCCVAQGQSHDLSEPCLLHYKAVASL